MKKTIVVAWLLLIAAQTSPAFGSDTAIRDDGREVILSADGTWSFKTKDHFATMPDGTRVRLADDGTWQKIVESPAVQLVPIRQGRSDVVQSNGVRFEMRSVRIENVRTTVQKNTRLRSQIVITLSTTGAEVQLNSDDFTLTDSRGRQYEVQNVTSKGNDWQIIAKGAPRWWGTKYLQLNINASSEYSEILLTKAMADIQKREVKALTDE